MRNVSEKGLHCESTMMVDHPPRWPGAARTFLRLLIIADLGCWELISSSMDASVLASSAVTEAAQSVYTIGGEWGG